MKTAHPSLQRYLGMLEDTASRPWTVDSTGLEAMRAAARAHLLQQGFPDRKQEVWRYTPVDRLLALNFVAAAPHDQAVAAPQALPELDSYRLVFVNGFFDAAASHLQALPAGVTVHGLAALARSQPQVLDGALRDFPAPTVNAFTAMHTLLSSDGIYIHVADGVHVDKPIEIIHHAVAGDQAVTSVPRIMVSLAAGARLTWIERFGHSGRSFYFQNVVAQIDLAAGASLDHYRLLEEGNEAFHLSSIQLRQQGNSSYRGLSMHLGGSWLRSDIQVDLDGEGARNQLAGFSFVDHGQLSDIHTQVRHNAPGCTSSENFRSLLLGAGRMVFDGLVRVAPDAQRSEAVMRNDNMLLSENAEVDSKPQLQIFADDVKCSHGATVGQLDADQVFYLRSRGIDIGMAKKLLCQGFIASVVDDCELQPVRAHALRAIDSALDRAMSSMAN